MILMRHGQSHFNLHFGKTHRDPGFRDPGLTPLGRQQVLASAEFLRDSDVRAIIASPYTRALESAAILADILRLDVAVDPTIGEQAHFTCDIGTPREELAQRWPTLALDHIPEQWWPTLTESDADMERRCLAFRTRMADGDGWRGVLVITHYHVIRRLTGHVVANAALVRFDPCAAHPGGGTVVHAPDP